MNEFNYIVAHVWPATNRLSAYTYFGQVSYGDKQQADEFLEYVKRQSPEFDWKIIKIDPHQVVE